MTKKPKSEKKALPPIRCKGCEIMFVPVTRKQKYHSPTCRNSYYDRTYFAKTETRKTCKNPTCGNPFTTTKPKLQDYCSAECRDDHNTRKVYGVTPILDDAVKCMLCEQNHRLLGQYNGLSLCRSCITIARAVDNGLATKYSNLLTS